jgi:hypothetical protein
LAEPTRALKHMMAAHQRWQHHHQSMTKLCYWIILIRMAPLVLMRARKSTGNIYDRR